MRIDREYRPKTLECNQAGAPLRQLDDLAGYSFAIDDQKTERDGQSKAPESRAPGLKHRTPLRRALESAARILPFKFRFSRQPIFEFRARSKSTAFGTEIRGSRYELTSFLRRQSCLAETRGHIRAAALTGRNS